MALWLWGRGVFDCGGILLAFFVCVCSSSSISFVLHPPPPSSVPGTQERWWRQEGAWGDARPERLSLIFSRARLRLLDPQALFTPWGGGGSCIRYGILYYWFRNVFRLFFSWHAMFQIDLCSLCSRPQWNLWRKTTVGGGGDFLLSDMQQYGNYSISSLPGGQVKQNSYWCDHLIPPPPSPLF